MSTSEPSLGRNPGLSNVADIVVAPNAAFERLRAVPTWGWAFLIATVLGVIGSVIVAPAIMHALQTSMPAQLAANPNIAKLPPDQQQKMINTYMGFARVFSQLSFVFIPIGILIGGLVQAVIMLIANAAGRGEGTFKKYFALSVNVSVIGVGISYIVLGLIVLVRGANSFESTTAVQGSLPSLALLMPGAKGAAAGFFGALNVFALWAIVLLALGMQRVGRVSPAVSWIAAIFMLVCTAALGAWGALRNG